MTYISTLLIDRVEWFNLSDMHICEYITCKNSDHARGRYGGLTTIYAHIYDHIYICIYYMYRNGWVLSCLYELYMRISRMCYHCSSTFVITTRDLTFERVWCAQSSTHNYLLYFLCLMWLVCKEFYHYIYSNVTRNIWNKWKLHKIYWIKKICPL